MFKISAAQIEQDCIINIDNVWKYENGKVTLSNTFDPYIVKKNKIQLELELIHEKGFVIAEEICIDDNYDKLVNACIENFIIRRKEVLLDETE